ncbi:MAG TPA: hypothetical protein VHM28_07445, partial [Anaerolineales bacterium]|nr:hypothetical protein [Anaerolineales bacterium]
LGIKSIPVLSADTPVAATEWLSNHPELPGPMWSDLTFSSYLIFALPSRPVWIDTRFEMIYPAAQYERYAEIARAAPSWPQMLDEEDINLLVLSKLGEPNLIEAIRSSIQWCEEYSDQIAIIYSRKISGEACP